jgi:DNA-binding MarR family transcriptional regulator
MTESAASDLDHLAQSLGRLRRAVIRDGFIGALAAVADGDLTVSQLALLFLLDEQELTTSEIAKLTCRSLSATSRLIDQLVKRGLVHRREDDQDRRLKWIGIAEPGRTVVAAFERRRAEAQLNVMTMLSAHEQSLVMQAMGLLAEAAKRRADHVQHRAD